MNHRLVRLATVPLGVLVLSLAVVALVSAFPLPTPTWLSRKIIPAGINQNQEANQYYARLQAPPTFELWKQTYGCPGSPEVNAIY